MERFVLRPLNRCCCCRFRGSRESEPLFLAVYKNSLEDVKLLVQSGSSVNVKSERGNTLLKYVIEHERVETFDYLLGLEDVDIDILDSVGRSPLLYSAGDYDDHFALQLIEKGADIHLMDDRGCTFLHLAAKRMPSDNDHIRVGELLLKKGCDINARNKAGETPLFLACQMNNENWMFMLLYYGADASIASNKGILPLVVAPRPYQQEILFNYTFDDQKTDLNLSTLAAAMCHRSPLFSNILQHVGDVTYDTCNLKHFCNSLIGAKTEYLRLFIKQFGHIVKEMIDYFPPLVVLLEYSPDRVNLSSIKEILYTFFDSDYVAELVQSSKPSYATIAHLIRIFNEPEMLVEEEEITKIVCVMLSYGLHVTSEDLDVVYEYYGHSSLFKMLLHMDIEIVSGNVGTAALYYSPSTKIETNDPTLCYTLLSYYNDPKLKESCLSHGDEIVSKVTSMPSMPCLVELSRNATRKYLLERYNIQNSRQFYTVLKWLPISETYKSIIALEKKLYWL